MMETEKKKALFTTLYPFMATVLHLAGLAKECFAVIFGFWISRGEHPVGISLATFQIITGGTRPGVIHAIRKLEDAGFVLAMRTPGKRTLYTVTIPETTMADYRVKYTNTQHVKPVDQQGYTPTTTTGKQTLQQNNNRTKRKQELSPLRVKSADIIMTGRLKEA